MWDRKGEKFARRAWPILGGEGDPPHILRARKKAPAEYSQYFPEANVVVNHSGSPYTYANTHGKVRRVNQRGALGHELVHALVKDSNTAKRLRKHEQLLNEYPGNDKLRNLVSRMSTREEALVNNRWAGKSKTRQKVAKGLLSTYVRDHWNNQTSPELRSEVLQRYKNFRRASRSNPATAHLKLSKGVDMLTTNQCFFKLMEAAQQKQQPKEGFLRRNRHKIAGAVAGAYIGKRLIDRFAPEHKEKAKDFLRSKFAPEAHSSARNVNRVAKAMKVDKPNTIFSDASVGGGAAYNPVADSVMLSSKSDPDAATTSMGLHHGTVIAHELGHKKTQNESNAFANRVIKSQERYLRRFGGRRGALSSSSLDTLRQKRVTLRAEAAASGAAVKKGAGPNYPRHKDLNKAFDTYRDYFGHGSYMERRLKRFDKAGGILGVPTRNAHLTLSARIGALRNLLEARRQREEETSPAPFSYRRAAGASALGGAVGAGVAMYRLNKAFEPHVENFDPSNYAHTFPLIDKLKRHTNPKFLKHTTAAALSKNPHEKAYHGFRALTHIPGLRRGAAAGAGLYGGYKLYQHMRNKKTKKVE